MANRLNVYIPADLRKRMDKVKDTNWSQIACEAFERKLGDIAAQKKDKKMSDVIQRLKASKMQSDSEARTEGRSAGIKWAKDSAEYSQLKRLAEHIASCGPDADEAFIITEGNAYSGAELFAFAALGGDPQELDRRDAEDFWQVAGYHSGVESLLEDEYVQAFAEGALEVWEEVSDSI